MFPVVPIAEQILGMSDHLSRWLGAGQTMLVHLYKNNLTPQPATLLADYTEVLVGDFPGYAPVPIATSGTPFLDQSGNVEQVFTDPVFQPTSDPVAPVTVYGYFVTLHPLAGPDTLLYGKRFDTPNIVSLASDAVVCDPDVSQVAFTAPATE